MSKYDNIDAVAGRIKVASALPTTPEAYYGSEGIIGSDEWVGGEAVYHSGDNRLYIQTATSGRTATWKRLLNQWATTTSSSTSSSSSSTSTSSSTSSSSSSTSTSSSSTTTA